MVSQKKLKRLEILVGYPVGIAEHDKITYTTLTHRELAEGFAKYGIRLYIGRANGKKYKKKPTTPSNERGVAHKLYSDFKPGVVICLTTVKQLRECLEYLEKNFGGNKS